MAVSTNRPRLLVPGLKAPDPFLETYFVRPGGATVLTLRSDDRVTVTDRDGGARAEITALAPDGGLDPDRLRLTHDAQATVLRAMIGNPGAGPSGVVAALAALGLNPAEATAAVLFGEWSPPGTSESFRAEREVVCVIAQPTGAPVVEGGVPQSDLWVEVRRSTPRVFDGPELPPPLADPRLDFRVDRATAQSYEVKAGEFIQIIDVEGRQCSDFLAFHRRKLEDGLERGLDATVTRTLMGNAYPMPGLHAKFYDQDFEPLVETVRDTVGRHDTFALACTSKYYEDMG
jgi:aminomethyltransferase